MKRSKIFLLFVLLNVSLCLSSMNEQQGEINAPELIPAIHPSERDDEVGTTGLPAINCLRKIIHNGTPHLLIGNMNNEISVVDPRDWQLERKEKLFEKKHSFAMVIQPFPQVSFDFVVTANNAVCFTNLNFDPRGYDFPFGKLDLNIGCMSVVPLKEQEMHAIFFGLGSSDKAVIMDIQDNLVMGFKNLVAEDLVVLYCSTLVPGSNDVVVSGVGGICRIDCSSCYE